jgi:hypothetical protein
MKRGIPTLAVLTLMLTNFASAATYSIRDGLKSVDSGIIFVASVFIISFALISFSTKKLFKAEKATSTVISLVAAFGITYGINSLDLDISNWFQNIGISETTLYTIIPFILIAIAVLIIWWLKRDSLIVFGLILFASAFAVVEQALVIILGVALIVIRIAAFKKKAKPSPLRNLLGEFLPDKKRKK